MHIDDIDTVTESFLSFLFIVYGYKKLIAKFTKHQSFDINIVNFKFKYEIRVPFIII